MVKKLSDFIVKIWKDSVWSKVIASTIIFIIAAIWTTYSNYSFNDILNFTTIILTKPFPIYLTLSAFGIFYLVRYAIRFFKPKTHSIWDEQVGNYKFKELYSVLQVQNYHVQTIGMQYARQTAPEENLLALFMAYAPIINMGVTLVRPHDDGGYLYGVLCPKLVSYGLVSMTVTEEAKLGSVEMIRYETSKIGHKFHSLVEKITHLQKEKLSGTTANIL